MTFMLEERINKKLSAAFVTRQTTNFSNESKLSAFALNFLRIIADGVGQSNRTIGFLLEVFVRDLRKVEGN